MGFCLTMGNQCLKRISWKHPNILLLWIQSHSLLLSEEFSNQITSEGLSLGKCLIMRQYLWKRCPFHQYVSHFLASLKFEGPFLGVFRGVFKNNEVFVFSRFLKINFCLLTLYEVWDKKIFCCGLIVQAIFKK